MSDLIKQITSYDLFNNLLPGIVFCYAADELLSFKLVQDDLLIAFFLYYFIGVIISRIGSIFVEPALIKIKFLEYSNYNDYITASAKDPKIDILLEKNNMYRTFISLLMTLMFLLLFKYYENEYLWLKDLSLYLLIGFLLFLFTFSYHKQTAYIRKRVKSGIDE